MDRMIIGPIIGLILLAYAAYCWQNEGTHVKGKGWMNKEEAPKSFLFNQMVYLWLGLTMVVIPTVMMLMK